MQTQTENPMVQVIKGARVFYDAQLKSLNGMMEKLPAVLRPEFEELRTNINNQLAQLPPLDQIPAALDLSYAMTSLNGLISRISDYAGDMARRLEGMQPKLVSLNSLETKINAKELLTKEEVKDLVEAGRQEERKQVTQAFKTANDRRRQVELAGLPMPADDVLLGEAAGFETTLATGKKNLDTAKKKGFDVKTKLVERCIYKPETEFATELDSLAEMIGGTPGKKSNLDPLKGGGASGGGAGGGAGNEGRRARVMV